MNQLEAMKFAMMNGAESMPSFGAPPQQPTRPQVDLAPVVAQLRAVLAAEHKARLAAEARLKAVLEHIARARAAMAKRAPPAAPPAAAAPAAPTFKVIEGGGRSAISDRIREVGGDEVDEQEERDG